MKNQIITKENGKMYWSKPYLNGTNALGQSTRLYIPYKHQSFLIERDDRVFGLPEGEMELTYEEVIRANPYLKKDKAFLSVADTIINSNI